MIRTVPVGSLPLVFGLFLFQIEELRQGGFLANKMNLILQKKNQVIC